MMYPYITLPDGTLITYSHLIMDSEQPRVKVYFEQPTEDGFKSAQCWLPEHRWEFNEGFPDDEMDFFRKLFECNDDLITCLATRSSPAQEPPLRWKRKAWGAHVCPYCGFGDRQNEYVGEPYRRCPDCGKRLEKP